MAAPVAFPSFQITSVAPSFAAYPHGCPGGLFQLLSHVANPTNHTLPAFLFMWPAQPYATEMDLSPPHTILISQTMHVAAASDTIPADDIIVQSQLLLLTQWLLQTPTKTQTWVGHFATWPATNLASLFVMWPGTKKGPFHNSQMKYKKA